VVFEKYDDNGIKLFTVEVCNGVANGNYTEFYADGSVRETRTYLQGMLHGESYRYSPEGKLIAQASFENNQKSGTWIVWNQFTEQKVVFTYVDGIKTGASYFFDKDGLILDTVLY